MLFSTEMPLGRSGIEEPRNKKVYLLVFVDKCVGFRWTIMRDGEGV